MLITILLAIPLRLAFVPSDDRPATQQFPQAVAAICGARLEMPQPSALGHFTQPGDTAAVARFIDGLDTQGLAGLLVSTDMLAYGGLVASRTPDVSLGDAQARIAVLSRFAAAHPGVPLYAFGTVMRLAPTATPESEPYMKALVNYANVAGAPNPTAEQRDALATSRSHVPSKVFWDYIGTRARDLRIDEQLVAFAADGGGVVALTQDDAGSDDGLQRVEEERLHQAAARRQAAERTLFLNPGADEMGMVMVARAAADAARVAPTLSIGYSREIGAQRDDLEYLPMRETIARLARFVGFRIVEDDATADAWLRVYAPHTSATATDAFVADLGSRFHGGKPTAVIDLSFVSEDRAGQRVLVERLRAAGLLAAPVAFASWNTTANTAGTALATLMCDRVAASRLEDPRGAEAAFLFARYADDYAYRLIVRPKLVAALQARGFDTYALGAAAAQAESEMRAALWPEAVSIFDEAFAQRWRNDRQTMTLPWQRTFEVRLDSDVSPR